MGSEDGIRRTLARYCQLFDSKQWDALGEIFTEDASITTRRGTFTGRAEVVRDLKGALAPGYHGTLLTCNTVITVSGNAASAQSDFLAVEETQILAVGTYTDALVRLEEEWLLKSREIRLK